MSSEDKPLENLIVEETKVDCTLGSDPSEQQNLLTHPRAKSKCWRFFSFRTDDNGKIAEKKQVFCQLCSITLSYSGNIMNLAYHIRKHHPEHMKDIKESGTKQKDNSDTSDPGLKQLSLQATLNKVKPYLKDSQRHQMLVNAVGEFICYGLQPINVADDPSFKKLMAKSDPKFQIPSRKYFSQHVIPNKYEAVKCKVQK